jgi:repressor LexA
MSRRQLTQKQHAFLEFLREHVERHKVWPTYREIVEHFEYRSPNSVTQNLQALKRKGFLRRDRDGYSLVKVAADDGVIPVRGRVRSGRVEPEADRFSLTALFDDAESLYALRLDERTGRPAALEGADYLLVSDGAAAEGDVLAVVGGGRLALAPAGPGGEPEGDVEVLGRYVGHAGPYGVVRARAAVAETA